jgi:hypothetical protein
MRVFILNGVTYIPGRYAAESLGFELMWDDASGTVIIQ